MLDSISRLKGAEKESKWKEKNGWKSAMTA